MTFLRYEAESWYSIVPFLLSGTPQTWTPKVTSGGMNASLDAGSWSTSAARHLGKFQSQH